MVTRALPIFIAEETSSIVVAETCCVSPQFGVLVPARVHEPALDIVGPVTPKLKVLFLQRFRACLHTHQPAFLIAVVSNGFIPQPIFYLFNHVTLGIEGSPFT